MKKNLTPDGRVLSVTESPNGLFTTFNSEGYLTGMVVYENNKKASLFVEFDGTKKGGIKRFAEYDNGQLLGPKFTCDEYGNWNGPAGSPKEVQNAYENGNTKSKGISIDGQKYGTWNYYDKTGELLYTRNYAKNIATSTIIYMNGKIARRYFVLMHKDKIYMIGQTFSNSGELGTTYYEFDDKYHGPRWSYYKETGKIYFEGYHVNGKKHGNFVKYYSNGAVKNSCVYKNGRQEGLTTYYNENGDIEMTTSINDNYYTAKYNNSQIKEEGPITEYFSKDSWVYDEEGLWKEYFKDGTLKAIGKYSEGFQIGEWKLYHSNGNIRASIIYSSDSDFVRGSIYNLSGEFVRPAKDEYDN